jgi:subtilase family protein
MFIQKSVTLTTRPITVQPRPVVKNEAVPAKSAPDSIVFSTTNCRPNRSAWRCIATEAAYWTRRLALNLAAPFAAVFNVGLGSSPAGVTGADELHKKGIDGRGTRVAVIDQAFTQFGAGEEDVLGVYRTRDKVFKPGLEKAKFTPGQEMATKRKPISTHGNAMSAIITGESMGLKGVAPGAEVIGISVIDEQQTLQTELFVDALAWVVENHEEQNIKVVSASVNYKNPTSEQREQVQKHVNQLKDQGVAVVVAAGNRGPDPGSVMFPADLENVMSVGASTPGWVSGSWDDRIEKYSSRGGHGRPGPTLVAPGGGIFTKDGHGGVDLTSGSSNSAPMVAGAYALLTQAYPSATYQQKVEALLSTAEPISGDVASEGRGVLNVPGSYQALATINNLSKGIGRKEI